MASVERSYASQFVQLLLLITYVTYLRNCPTFYVTQLGRNNRTNRKTSF